MRDISEKRAVELRWPEVSGIVSEAIREVLGLQVQCKVNVVEDSFWDVTFIGCRLPLPKLCQLLQAAQATPEDWEDALPDEGGADVGGIGIVLAEKLISRHLKLTWEHHLITADSLSSLNKSTQKHNNSMDCQPYAKHRFRQNGAVFLYGFWTP